MGITKSITAVLGDDHAIVREGIAAKFKERPEISIVGECSDGEEVVEMIDRLNPDFAIFDLQMRKLSGADIVKHVRLSNERTKLILLSISRDESVIADLFRNGANGYVLKDGPARHLFDAITYILDGGQYLTPLLQRETIEAARERRDPLSLLSKREYEVFLRLVEGMRPRDIAKLLNISPKTVDTYRANIMRKLEVAGIAGLVRFAIERHLSASALQC